jgi:hypothetical protein
MSRSELGIKCLGEIIAQDHREHGTLHARKQLKSVVKRWLLLRKLKYRDIEPR